MSNVNFLGTSTCLNDLLAYNSRLNHREFPIAAPQDPLFPIRLLKEEGP